MSAQPQNTDSIQKKPRFESEIELMDYLLIIWKWKYLIMGGLILCASIIGIITLLKPKPPSLYRTKMVLKSTVKDIDKFGKRTYFITAQQIKSLISVELKYTLNTRNVAIDVPENSNVLSISYVTSKVQEGAELFNNIIESVKNQVKQDVKINRNSYENEMLLKKRNLNEILSDKKRSIRVIEILEKKIDEMRKQNLIDIQTDKEKSVIIIKILEKKIDEMKKKNEFVKKNLKILNDQRNDFFNKTDKDLPISTIVFMNKLQQNLDMNIAYDNLIYHDLLTIEKEKLKISGIRNNEKEDSINMEYPQIYNDLIAIEREKNHLSRLKNNEKEVSREIEYLQKNLNKIEPIMVIQPPVETQLAEKDMRLRNISVSVALSFVFMILLAFFLEYVVKYRNRAKQIIKPH